MKRLLVVPVLIEDNWDVPTKLIGAIEALGGEVITPSGGTTRILSWDPEVYGEVNVTVKAPRTETRVIPGHVQGAGVS